MITMSRPVAREQFSARLDKSSSLLLIFTDRRMHGRQHDQPGRLARSSCRPMRAVRFFARCLTVLPPMQAALVLIAAVTTVWREFEAKEEDGNTNYIKLGELTMHWGIVSICGSTLLAYTN